MMMNENNEVFTMEDEPLASVVQNMRKGSKWLSAFLESYRPPLDGERYLTDRAPCQPPHLAGVPQQQGAALYPFGREGALPRIGVA